MVYIPSSTLTSRLEELRNKVESCSKEDLSTVVKEVLNLASDSIASLSHAEKDMEKLTRIL